MQVFVLKVHPKRELFYWKLWLVSTQETYAIEANASNELENYSLEGDEIEEFALTNKRVNIGRKNVGKKAIPTRGNAKGSVDLYMSNMTIKQGEGVKVQNRLS